MARFRAENLILHGDQKVRFGVDYNNLAQTELWWDTSAPHPTTSGDLRLSSTISGVNPIYDYHLTTKWYVDNAITTISGLYDEHNELKNIQGGATDEYYHLTDVEHYTLTSRSGVLDASNLHHHNSLYFTEDEITTISGDIVNQIITDHGDLTGLNDDDHTHYTLATGLRPFTGTVSGIDPTEPEHLTTKFYVDTAISQSLTNLDWQNSVLSQNVAFGDAVASGSNRYIAPTTSGDWVAEYIYEWTGTSWSGIEPNEGFAAWVEDEDLVYFYDDAYPAGTWIKMSSTMVHNNLGGLQGGTTNEYYHLTSTMYTDLTSFGGVNDAGSQHHHDGRYYTESEVDTISGSLQVQIDGKDNYQYWQFAVDGTPYDNITSTDILNFVSGSNITVTRSAEDEITISGTAGVTYHGRQAVAYKAQQVTVNFADLGHTNYTVNATLQNTADSPPSIYAFIISGKTSSSFTADFSGKMDSANYYLNWLVVED